MQARNHEGSKQPQKKLRTACDICHQAKMKCTGGTPCAGCRDSGYDCSYSVSNRIGRPKGTKNKRTLDRMNRNQNAHSLDKVKVSHSRSGSSSLGNGSSKIPRNKDDSPAKAVLSGAHVGGSFPLPGSEAFMPLPTDSWYGFGNIDNTAPYRGTFSDWMSLQQSSSFGSSYDPAVSSMDGGQLPFFHDDSAYVSPTSVFNDKSSLGSTPDLSLLFGNTYGDVADLQGLEPSSPSLAQASSATCNCIQNHAILLTHVRELEQYHSALRLEFVLSGAQKALVPWKSVIECNVCQRNDNQEVLIMSALSMCTILRILQNLCSEYYNSVNFGEEMRSLQRWVPNMPSGMNLATGTYGIIGEESMAVTDLLIARTLDQVRHTLTGLKERLDVLKRNKTTIMTSPYKTSFAGHIAGGMEFLQPEGSGDFNNLMQLWRNLDGTVQILERGMRSGNPLPSHGFGAVSGVYA